MLKAEVVSDVIDGAYSTRCCGRKIVTGEVVLHLKLGSNFPYDCRQHYFHPSCMAETLAEAEELVPDAVAWLAETREKMIATGQFLVDA